ncbi:carbohydrate porin [Hankyongella ginsenosidimutans]|uniref:carbohydrate porin n=1 Tax=Hankyongella ginsenosidimutans TaxID=1763828 RepID=UPI001CA37D5D
MQAVRLYEAWLQHDLPNERASLRFGLYDLNSEFDALATASLFINSAHGIGVDIGQSGQAGPSIFPLTSLSARLEVAVTPALRVRVAVLDGVPADPDRPRRTAVKLGNGDGVLTIGEVDYTLGPARVIAGYWRYTAPFEVALDSALTGFPWRAGATTAATSVPRAD